MLTFSRAAATEFKKRLIALVGNAAHFVEIKTFHSYSFDLIGRQGSLEEANSVVLRAAEMIESGEVEESKIAKSVLVIDEAQDMGADDFRLVKANSMKDDYRNFLFESFVKIVDHYQPKAFVFENVPGLLSACPGNKPVRIRIFEAFKAIGYDIRTPDTLKNSVYCAEDFNVPQKRNRIIIIGTKHDSEFNVEEFYSSLSAHKMKGSHKTVKEAIGKMPALTPKAAITKDGRKNVSHEQLNGEYVDRHEPRYHGERDQRLFTEWLGNNMNKASQAEKMAIYTRITGHTSNHVKYRNLEWDKPSATPLP